MFSGSYDNGIYAYAVDNGRVLGRIPAHDDAVMQWTKLHIALSSRKIVEIVVKTGAKPERFSAPSKPM